MRPFHMPTRHKELINKAYPDQNWREMKPLAGFSGAYVYKIVQNNHPVIVKIAHPAVIKREVDNYDSYVTTLGERSPRKFTETVESEDGLEAMLRYTFAGNVDPSTLFEFLETEGNGAVNQVRKMLRKMFTVGNVERPRSWWGRADPVTTSCRDHYDRWMPVYLALQWLPGVVDNAELLNAEHIYRKHVDRLVPGQIVKLQDFQVEKEKGEVVTLYLGDPYAPSFRVKLMGATADTIRDTEPIYASIKETRRTLFEKHGKAIDKFFSADHEHFRFNGYNYNNPLYYLDEMLDKPHDAIVSTIHGDLNLRNILIEEKSSAHDLLLTKLLNKLLDKQYDWWLIDFASTQKGPVLLDLQWLEVQVINWLLVPALQQAGHGPHALRILLTALHHRRPLPLRLRSKQVIALYKLLVEIRRLAEGYLVSPRQNPERWQEYYRGLTLAMLSTLKHEQLSEEIGDQVKTYALIGAATMVGWSGVGVKKVRRVDWNKVGKYVSMATATALGLLGAYFLVITFLLPPSSCDPSLKTLEIGYAINDLLPYGEFGKDQKMSVAIAKQYFNEKGGIHGHCIDLVLADLKSIAQETDKNKVTLEGSFQGLIDQGVVAIIGPGLSQQVKLLKGFLEKAKTPIIGPSTTLKGIICDKEFFMRVSAPGAWYIQKAIDEMHRMIGESNTAISVAIAYADDDTFTHGEYDLLAPLLKENPSYVFAGEVAYQINQTGVDQDKELENVATKLLTNDPDMVIIAGLTLDGRKLVHELRKQEYFKPIFGGNGLNTPYLFDSCGIRCQDFDNFYMAVAYDNTDNLSKIKADFLESYQNLEYEKPLYDPNPGQFAAQMFSGIQVIVESLNSMDAQLIHNLDNSSLDDLRRKLNQELRRPEGFDTPLGSIKFTSEGEIIQKDFYLSMSKQILGQEGYSLEIIRPIPNDEAERLANDECS